MRWRRRDFASAAVYLGMIFGPWLVIAGVVVGILFVVGVLP